MKLFQKLLLAPAAIGVLTPMTASASEVNLKEVSSYSQSGIEISQDSFKPLTTANPLLAGGEGSRIGPSTKAISKQLIPLADKPIIFYSLSILMLLNIKNILLVVKKQDQASFKKLS